ncbi:hypothetical protein OOU_Y34scaffold00151g20 [Pyricularia oryzae Y34]|uniref:Uncharacterized protein n=3 Tax=Pyricularia oryzae TaxID=318829 RepID=A0A4P7MUI6_PYROR|nr:hypothetical protein OOU_Y34scaffold00151g20 [Pyricularia oryzae Y34]QBZ53809.1 hypothetical protein PoMZ_09499 [Pyricularia oryzae]
MVSAVIFQHTWDVEQWPAESGLVCEGGDENPLRNHQGGPCYNS